MHIHLGSHGDPVKYLQGVIKRKNGSIVLLDSDREERWRWNFSGAYPVRWVGPELLIICISPAKWI